MKKLLGIVVLGLLWCNVGIAAEREPGKDPTCFKLGTIQFNKQVKIYLTSVITVLNHLSLNFGSQLIYVFVVDSAANPTLHHNKPRTTIAKIFFMTQILTVFFRKVYDATMTPTR